MGNDDKNGGEQQTELFPASHIVGTTSGPMQVAEPAPERRVAATAGGDEAWRDLTEWTEDLLRAERWADASASAGQMISTRPSDLVARLMAAEAAIFLNELESADEHLTTARLLITRRTPGVLCERWRDLSQLSAGKKARAALLEKLDATRRKRASTARAERLRTQTEHGEDRHPEVPVLEPELELIPDGGTLSLIPGGVPELALGDYRLRRTALAVANLRSFETLLALGHVRGVDHYGYQLRTVTRVLRDFLGRVLLADEVGLGKTIEACLCLKEYLLRGVVSNALILVPPGLRAQWRDELANKFQIEASVIDGDKALRNPDVWSGSGIRIASLGLARVEPHASNISRARFDLVIVDEAHRLKNRRTRSWQVIDHLRSRFLLLLSATPIENDVIEIYNVLSLLKPGLFSTESEFRRSFVGDDRKRSVKDPGQLRRLLREVMIRNTRALAEAKLPQRFATTLRAVPDDAESQFYADLAETVRAGLTAGSLRPLAAGDLLRSAGSSPAAAAVSIERIVGRPLAERARSIVSPAKDRVLLDLLARRSDEKVLLFAAHKETLYHLLDVVGASGRRAALFHGGLSQSAKEDAIAAFAADHDVLVASESGGEGFNLQFARTIVNYDLPWNPMRIEQRIGRVHRIGQTREVFVFNMVTAGTIEEEVVRVLDEKINMFELVVGEIDAILGRLGDDEKEFQDLVLEIYTAASDEAEVRARFDDLAAKMIEARKSYQGVKNLEEAAFGRDLEA